MAFVCLRLGSRGGAFARSCGTGLDCSEFGEKADQRYALLHHCACTQHQPVLQTTQTVDREYPSSALAMSLSRDYGRRVRNSVGLIWCRATKGCRLGFAGGKPTAIADERACRPSRRVSLALASGSTDTWRPMSASWHIGLRPCWPRERIGKLGLVR